MEKEFIEPKQVQVTVVPYHELDRTGWGSIDQIIYDLNSKIELLSNQADSLDYLVSAASGMLCGMLDILWVGQFDLARGRNIASEQVDDFVRKTAKMLGCEKTEDISDAVKFLEEKFPIPSDGNTPDFGGGLQHHLRDFAHHPTAVGLIFSLLTQFTCKSYGTDTHGRFICRDVPERSKAFIGRDVPEKILFGTVYWFFHLVSDMAGSSSTAGKSGGTGIPGPLLSLIKELSALPFFQNLSKDRNTLSLFLSKLFNGTLLAKRGKDGKIIKDTVLRFDLRTELGVAVELGRQAVPVVANECIVRTFYFVRRLAWEIKEKKLHTLEDLKKIDWERVKPSGNATIARMLTVSTGVFTALDVSSAVITQKYWVSINYVGVCRFAIAVGSDVNQCLKVRDVKKIRDMYAKIRYYVYTGLDDEVYQKMGEHMNIDRFGLTVDQTEILYNLEYQKVKHDISETRRSSVSKLKAEWLEEWKAAISKGFPDFVAQKDAQIHWYSREDLILKIKENSPRKPWYRLALLEAMVFEPYYPLSVEQDKKGKDIPSKKYDELQYFFNAYDKAKGDKFLDAVFTGTYCSDGYVSKRLRKCHSKCLRALNESMKAVIQTILITMAVTVVAVFTAGIFAPQIAVLLVGSNFAGLHGAALINACLAFLGGGAVAAGGMGMAGGIAVIVGGSGILGLGVGAGAGGIVASVNLIGKEGVMLQSAKLMVSLREIFLNDEKDVELSSSVYEQYVQNIVDIQKQLVDMKMKEKILTGDMKKNCTKEIKVAEDAVKTMEIARKDMFKFQSAFESGLG